MIQDLNDIANILAITALIPLSAFVFFYGTKKVPGKRIRRYSSLWRSTAIGRVLMYQKITWIAFLLFVLHSLFLDYAGQDIVRIIVYAALVTQFWVVFFTLRRIQKQASKFAESGESQVIPPKTPEESTK